MEQTIKTEKVLSAYRVLSTAKYNKMDDKDKIKMWKIARAMKPIATQFEDDSKDAAEKMKPTEDFADRLSKAQEYEAKIKDKNLDASTLPMGAAEYGEFVKEFQNYQKLVGDTVKEYADKEVTLKFDGLNEEAFGKLMASNEWTMDQVMEVGSLIVE